MDTKMFGPQGSKTVKTSDGNEASTGAGAGIAGNTPGPQGAGTVKTSDGNVASNGAGAGVVGKTPFGGDNTIMQGEPATSGGTHPQQ
jgi:hypothetical protein